MAKTLSSSSKSAALAALAFGKLAPHVVATHPALETTEHPKEINPARLARLDDPLRQPAKRAAKEQEAKPSREAPRGASSDENEAPRQQAKQSTEAPARQKKT